MTANLFKTHTMVFGLLAASFCSVAQVASPTYAAKWATIDSLIDHSKLPESALTQVNIVYTRAKAEKNDVQVIKALIYQMRLQEFKQEEATIASIGLLDKEIGSMRQPARSILESIQAESYWNYFQQNRYKLYQRTTTEGYIQKDPSTWSSADLLKKITALYLSSIREEKLLQGKLLTMYDPILTSGNTRALRPTLFDLLAHRALTYFTTDERDLSKPSYAFEIDDPSAFADANDFVTLRFQSYDSLSLRVKALQLFQRLIRTHLQDNGPSALLDVDIERLQFVHTFAVTDKKDSLYENALSRITNRYGDMPAAAQAWYLQAQQYASRASAYDPITDTTHQYDYLIAKKICDKVLAQKEQSEGRSNCETLLKSFTRKTLDLQTEKVSIPGQPMRTLVRWSNFSQLYLRVIRLDHTTKDNLGNNTYDDAWWKKLLQLPATATTSQALPETNDYQAHRTEIKTDALPVGQYALLASADPSFPLTKNPLAVQFFYVSSISWMNYEQDYFVVDRTSGQPLSGASVQIWKRAYDYGTRRNSLTRAETYQTDKHGRFTLDKKKDKKLNNNGDRLLEVTNGADHLFMDEYSGIYYREETDDDKILDRYKFEQENLMAFLFTDRSIYRPGQTLYVKGIVVTRDPDTRRAKILKGFRTKISLHDANGNTVDSIPVQTNEFGSYQARFTLPQNLLNGQFSVTDDSTGNSQTVSVEEYKRPQFYVDYPTDKGSHRPGDTIHIVGTAMAYAGNNIDGAVVQYRVIRQARFPWSDWGFRVPHASRSQEIVHGQTKTDNQGKFHIQFTALPDRSVNEKADPIFDYTVSADVTDINGETRSGQTLIRAGYTTLHLTITQPGGDRMPADSLTKLSVQASSLSGEPQAALVTVNVYSLQSPDRPIRERLYARPDQFTMSREQYMRYFPHDDYGDDLNKEKWARNAKILTATDSSGHTINVAALAGKKLSPGWYLLEARSKDKYGLEIKTLRYVELYDGRTGRPGSPSYNWAAEVPAAAEPNDTIRILSGSSAGNIFLIRKREEPETDPTVTKGTGVFGYLDIDKNGHVTEIPVVESDRGGFQVSDAFISDNRLYVNSYTVNVPWSNKELDITYTTSRDKTLPGSEEKWQIHISGHRSDKVSAEVLAGMYDASLDAFSPHSWSKPELYPVISASGSWQGSFNFTAVSSQQKYDNDDSYSPFDKRYDVLLSPGNMRTYAAEALTSRKMKVASAPMSFARVLPGATKSELAMAPVGGKEMEEDTRTSDSVLVKIDAAPSAIQPRKNFNETAFFFPDLRTDSSGNLTLSFTMPEALTKWKMMMLAHTRDLSFGYSEKTVITQKQLMVQPNMPRFLREGDRMELSVKVVNMTDSEMTGQMELQLTDPTTGQTADGRYTNRQPNQYFTVGAGQSAVVNFPIDVPFQYNRPVQYRVTAKAHNYSDGEEAIMPVVSNRMLVTESLPLNLQGDGTRTFKFDKLLQSGSSETLNHHALTVEFTGNPAWYAVQALPYLMEFPYECAEQTFNRFYANALASSIVKSSPRIREIFQRWRTTDTAALLSNLEKNPELRSVLLQETPWVLKGKSESEQKKNIALLFDMTKMAEQLSSTIAKLAAMQSSNGGFVWFKGGPDDRYITQYIMTGIGHLQFLQAIPESSASTIHAMIRTAIPYLDKLAKEDYEKVRRSTAKVQPIGPITIQYLYMRSMFSNPGIPGDVFPAVNYFRKQAQQSWQQEGIFSQAMTALALYRTGDKQTAVRIMASLKETGIKDPEKGMYYKGMERAYYWYQSPIETQSMVIEAFHTISPDATVERDLKTWLLTNKQTHSWSTTRATADACYALLLDGAEWLTAERSVDIRLGDKTASTGNDGATEAGTGYFKKVFNGPFVNPSMGNITVTMTTKATPAAAATQPRSTTQAKGSPTDKPGAAASSMPAWGAVYWQYFDNLDRITASGNGKAPLKLVKKLFVTTNTDRGPALQLLAENGVLHPGDKVTVRIELQSDRDLEYVHMKDMRGACMEPVNVLSEYKWQGGLGYYESTRDVSTDFFFSRMPRGSYVFEYPVFVGQTGNFSNGVTSIECMYAPEFSFHSEGIRVNVE